MSAPYIVSARKYRPSTFSAVVGQSSLTRTLKNSIETGRLAQAYLFCGPRGVGKTSCARIFAKTINCEHRTAEGEACGQCESCRDFERGVSYNVIELDAASNNGVDQMRTLTEQVNVPPASGRYRVFIIDEVHMLSTGAFNAFLKTLEEPPSYAIFILATTEKNKVLPTILSRCQTYDFARITERDIALQLQAVAHAEKIAAEPEALEVIARKADGAMRDALSIFDQVAAASGANVTYAAAIDNLNVLDYETYFHFTDAFAEGNVGKALLLYRDVRNAGFDARFFISGLAAHVRNLLVAMAPETASLLEVGQKAAQHYMQTAKTFSPQWYYGALKLLQDCDINFREASDKQLLTELTLIRLCQLSNNGTTDHDSHPAPLRQIAPSPQPQVSAPAETPATPALAPAPAPQRQSPSRSTVIPAPRPQNVARPKGRSIRLSNKKSVTDDASAENPVPNPDPLPEGNKAPVQDIDPAMLENAWHEFMVQNTDKKLLLAAMRRGLPNKTDKAQYELCVDNQAQLQEAESNLNLLADCLRQATGNNALTLTVRQQAPAERPRALSPKETLAEMVRKQPSVAKLMNLIDAEQIS